MLDKLLYNFKTGNYVTKLLYLNIGVFALISVLGILNFMLNLNWYSDGSGVRQLFIVDYLSANSDPYLLLTRPWTLITYMFTHEDLFHILVNMLIFYYIGSIFIDLLGDKKLLPLYITGGIAGLLLFVLLYNVLPGFNSPRIPIIGASASVMAIMLATATYVPNYPIRLMFLGAIPLKYIAGFYVLIDLLALRGSSGNLGGHIAHLGGAIYGFAYAKQLAKGNDFARFYYLFVNSFKGIFIKQPKVKVVHNDGKGKKKGKNSTTADQKSKQARVDAILDKISKSGYENLTKEEKDFLFKASRD